MSSDIYFNKIKELQIQILKEFLSTNNDTDSIKKHLTNISKILNDKNFDTTKYYAKYLKYKNKYEALKKSME